MIIPFCPFIKGDCKTECIFNNGCLDEGNVENCNIYSAILTILSLDNEGSLIDKRLTKIISEASSISSNTSDNYEIRDRLDEIKKILDKNNNK